MMAALSGDGPFSFYLCWRFARPPYPALIPALSKPYLYTKRIHLYKYSPKNTSTMPSLRISVRA